jgi:aspartate kinase
MIVQNISHAGTTDISFTVPKDDLATSIEVCNSLHAEMGGSEVTTDSDIARVSLIGAGRKTNPGVAATMFETLAGEGVNIEMISTSSIRISCVVRAEQMEKAVRALHDAFKLESA